MRRRAAERTNRRGREVATRRASDVAFGSSCSRPQMEADASEMKPEHPRIQRCTDGVVCEPVLMLMSSEIDCIEGVPRFDTQGFNLPVISRRLRHFQTG